MTSRGIEAALGLFLVSAMLTGTATQEIPSNFFINQKTGLPNVVIVVGSAAASEDVISATELAAVIGSMCREYESTSGARFEAVHENIVPAPYNERSGFSTSDVPDAQLYSRWEHNNLPLTYTLQSLWYFNSHAFWSYDYGHFQPWETHEEIQICFDFNDRISEPCLPCLYGGDTELVKLGDEFDLSGWWTMPGLIYRADNIFAPPSVSVEMRFDPIQEDSLSMASVTFYMPEPWMVMQGMLPQFKLFSTLYTVVDAGPVLDINSLTGQPGPLHKTPYMVTGEPYFRTQILYLNTPLEISSYAVEVTEVDLERSKALFKIYENGKLQDTFWLILDHSHGFAPNIQDGFPFDSYHKCNDLNKNGVLDPGEATNIIGEYDGSYEVFDKWVVGQIEGDVWVVDRVEYYKDDQNISWVLFQVATIAIDGVRVFTDDLGDGVEIQIYWLENEKVWYNHLCSDPWSLEPANYQLFLDAYQAGWDQIEGNSYAYQPPGTGLWPPAGLNMWKSSVGNSTFVGNGFLDSNDGHTGYEYFLSGEYFPEQNDLDRDKNTTNDCRNAVWEKQESCQNRHDIEDPMVLHGAGPILVELNVLLCDTMCAPSEKTWHIPCPFTEEPAYFTIEVFDADLCDTDGISYKTLMNPVQTEIMPANADETGLVMLDITIDFSIWESTCCYNLIIIGGPVANTITNHLVERGISTVDWFISSGEWEYIKAPSNGCDILIVAGRDRDATQTAVHNLINYLQIKP